MDYSSPNRLKILQLNDKLRDLDTNQRPTSPSFEAKLPNLQTRINYLGEKLKRASQKDDAKYRPLEMEIAMIEDAFKSQKRDFEVGIADKQESVRDLQRFITGIVEQLSNDLKEQRLGIIKGLQQKIRVVKGQYSQSTRTFRQSCLKTKQQIQNRVSQAREAIINERKSRDQTSQFLIKSFGEQILKLQQILNVQKTDRMKGNKQALSLIQQIEDNLLQQIQDQKDIKNRNQQLFTKLLQQTCYKIQQSFLQ